VPKLPPIPKAVDGRIKVLALPGDASGCTLWRIWNPFKNLLKAGYPCWWGWVNAEDSSAQIPNMDVVIMPRLSWNPGDQIKAVRWRDRVRTERVSVLADWDDDLFSPEFVDRQFETSAFDFTKDQLREFHKVRLWGLELVDGHTVSTSVLAEVVRRFTSKPVRVLPNAIDVDWWRAVQSQYGDPIDKRVVGWIGGNRPDRDAQELGKAWKEVSRRHPDVLFLVMGHPLPSLVGSVPEDQLVQIPWLPLEAYPFPYAMVDIGCCPLADELFNRSKSPIKSFEFGLSGAVVLASPTVYETVIEHEKTGFICHDADEWEGRIEQMLANGDERREIAARWERTVVAQHSIEANMERYYDTWTELYRSTDFGPWISLEGLSA
jgi:glycosyltransferase involved in cell wall biosynthesis